MHRNVKEPLVDLTFHLKLMVQMNPKLFRWPTGSAFLETRIFYLNLEKLGQNIELIHSEDLQLVWMMRYSNNFDGSMQCSECVRQIFPSYQVIEDNKKFHDLFTIINSILKLLWEFLELTGSLMRLCGSAWKHHSCNLIVCIIKHMQ